MTDEQDKDHKAERARANEEVRLPRYRITRLESRLARTRAQRDAERKKYRLLMSLAATGLSDYYRSRGVKSSINLGDSQRECAKLRAELIDMQDIVGLAQVIIGRENKA